ncbi:MAG: winged helix-turn-helix transcriptional regulator [Candidatus Heimdallarchaeaceae archaeon]
MDYLNILDMRILHVLQNYPLEPYSAQAEKLKISPQTMIRRVKALQDKEILRNPIASFVPERISLYRYGVMFSISSLHQCTLLQNALSEHKYIRAYNRFYGESFGIYAHFELPENTEQLFNQYLEHLVEQEYCDSYFTMKSMGYRFTRPQPLPNYTQNAKPFDLISYWEKRLSKSTSLPRLPSAIDLQTLEPLHFQLLKDLTTSVKNGIVIDIRTKQTDLIKHYQDKYNHLTKKNQLAANSSEENKLTFEEESMLFNLSEFFDDKNLHNTKVEFGRRYYNLVMNNLITNPRWNFSRKLFEQHATRAYFIENVPEKEKAQLFRFFNEEKIPFQSHLELYNKGIFLRLTMPPHDESNINYLIWSTFKDYKIYSLDFFGKHGLYWTFEYENFDFKQKKWRVDKDWMLDSTIAKINDKLINGNFGKYKPDQPESKNQAYLRKHIANGNGATA